MVVPDTLTSKIVQQSLLVSFPCHQNMCEGKQANEDQNNIVQENYQYLLLRCDVTLSFVLHVLLSKSKKPYLIAHTCLVILNTPCLAGLKFKALLSIMTFIIASTYFSDNDSNR